MGENLSDPVVIGVVAAPHGVRGTVRVKPVGDGRHLRAGMSPLLDGVRREIVSSRPTPKGFLVDFAGFEDRRDVESLHGMELTLDRLELDEPDDGEIYVSDLIGLEVMDENGGRIGTVTQTFPTAAHEILVVRDGDSPELYVPFTFEHVPEIDLAAGRVTANPPEPDGG